MDGFTALAQYYDRFVGADYGKISAFIDRMIKTHFPDAVLVCDIGCGSGTLTFALLEKGYDMIGIDGSIEMLSEAFDKRIEIPGGEKALFLCQQLPEFELYGTVDVIISTLDTINYITDENDLDRLFYWFRNYLNPKGLLIFDVNSLYKYQSLLNQHCEVFEDEDVFLSWRSQFDGVYCSHQLTFFAGNDRDVYERSDEDQLQRYYSVDEITALLLKYGFELLNIYDDYTECAPNEKTQRYTFIALKKE